MKQSYPQAPQGALVAPYHQIPDFKDLIPSVVAALTSFTILYCRLSKDDKLKEKDDDSNSIANQKMLLAKFAQDHQLPNPVFFVDDGVSGTTFDRPDFLKAIELVEAKRVKNFVVKDMSRFGRGHIRVGIYTKILFPENNVRFVAIYDDEDSDTGGNEMTPFKNIMNEWYARDTSKKIRAVFRAKGMAGQALCFTPPYGYLKDQQTKQWLLDEIAAPVVSRIFALSLDGIGPSRIARH
ncbi:MAG: recombinase family protein [Oscillospiraceae bacterium]|jgi:DNA invertase Pin-like site-specific DNA recombinase|nr:recombinase family protein [Oscillospiraceae bacterium]